MDLQDLPEILESQDFPVRLAKEESEANVVTLASVEHVATKAIVDRQVLLVTMAVEENLGRPVFKESTVKRETRE